MTNTIQSIFILLLLFTSAFFGCWSLLASILIAITIFLIFNNEQNER